LFLPQDVLTDVSIQPHFALVALLCIGETAASPAGKSVNSKIIFGNINSNAMFAFLGLVAG